MILRNRKQPSWVSDMPLAPIKPEVPFFAVGDIHGSDHLLEKLLRLLDDQKHPEALLVTVGDYVDRGEESSRALRRLHVISAVAGELMHCLMGNHEKMLLDTLDDPQAHGPRWIRHGGLQTLASYRIQPVLGEGTDAAWFEMRDRLEEAMGADLINWLRRLPLFWQTGNVVVTHAGADPDLPINMQDSRNLLWGHPDFTRKQRADGLWVVHGHTITESPVAAHGRIPTDTGAYATGVLTAALVETEKVSYIQAR